MRETLGEVKDDRGPWRSCGGGSGSEWAKGLGQSAAHTSMQVTTTNERHPVSRSPGPKVEAQRLPFSTDGERSSAAAPRRRVVIVVLIKEIKSSLDGPCMCEEARASPRVLVLAWHFITQNLLNGLPLGFAWSGFRTRFADPIRPVLNRCLRRPRIRHSAISSNLCGGLPTRSAVLVIDHTFSSE